MGVFLVFMGLDKVEWFLDGGLLTQQLQEWRGQARPLARWYLEAIALPAAPVFRARGTGRGTRGRCGASSSALVFVLRRRSRY